MKRRRIPRSRAEGRVSSAVTAAAAGAMGMARKCCVRSCKADVREARAKGLPLHKFPKDAVLRDRWLASGGFEAGFRPTPGQVVCHRHFKRADYEAARGGHKLLLRRGSVPTVFVDYDEHPGTCVRDGRPDGQAAPVCDVRPPAAAGPKCTSPVKRNRNVVASRARIHLSLSPSPSLSPASLHRVSPPFSPCLTCLLLAACSCGV